MDGPLIAMFGLSGDTVAIGTAFFRSIASCYVVFGLAMAVRGYLEGAGDMVFSGIAGLFALGVRIAASYAFGRLSDSVLPEIRGNASGK